MEQRQADREFLQLMIRNEERGVLTNATKLRLKKLGFDLGKINSSVVEEAIHSEKESGGSCQLEIDRKYINRQYKSGEIKDKEWKPKSTIYHEDDFFEWINSITFGFFPLKIRYEPFEKYKAQAQYWFETAKNPYDTSNFDLRKEIIMQEYDRIDRSTLYYSMKYGWVKEGNARSGKIPYVPKEHNALIFYLIDCGYCMLLGKPRQIFATTTIGLYINKKLITQENFYMKFITEDIETGMEILSDKVKIPFNYHSGWMKPTVSRDYIKGFRLGKKLDKGEIGYPNSRIEVVAPSKTAINGGSPQVVLVDEVGNVPDLIQMILEAVPTLSMDVKQDGNLELKRQILCWGTGVSDNRGKSAYQSLFTDTVSLWERKQFKSALFVPVFLSWHTRCSEKIYKEEQGRYYGGTINDIQNYSAEEQKQIFHMHFPSEWRDMFAMASNKLVSREFIEGNLKRIRGLKEHERARYGFFEPIYDYTKPYKDDNIGIPYRIIGSKFIPYDDNVEDKDKVSVILYKEPEHDWENRYYQGTDPIATETGLSNFGGAIWDEEDKTYPCILNYRKSQDHRAAFLQSILMGLYYDNRPNGMKQGVPELIENNIGTNYKDYKELLGFDKNIIYNKELPIEMQGGGALWGFNCKQKKKEMSVANLSDVVLTYGKNINIDIIFKQLDTYTPTQTSSGISWSPADKRLHRDDVLDACAYAYIARKCNESKIPKNIKETREENQYLTRYEYHRLPNGKLIRQPKKIKIIDYGT